MRLSYEQNFNLSASNLLSEFYSDLAHDKDYYDGLIDITHASEWVTISNTYLHDHWKASLIGHSDNNAAQDTGHLHVTQHNVRVFSFPPNCCVLWEL